MDFNNYQRRMAYLLLGDTFGKHSVGIDMTNVYLGKCNNLLDAVNSTSLLS